MCVSLLAQAADVYAFGILLWEMCTGQKPWVGLKEQEIITKVVQNEKQPLFPRDTPAPFKVHLALCYCVSLFFLDKACHDCVYLKTILAEGLHEEFFTPDSPHPLQGGALFDYGWVRTNVSHDKQSFWPLEHSSTVLGQVCSDMVTS